MSYDFKSPVATAKDVLKKYEINSVPVDVEGICEKEHIRIRYVNFDDIEKLTKKISPELSRSIQNEVVQFL